MDNILVVLLILLLLLLPFMLVLLEQGTILVTEIAKAKIYGVPTIESETIAVHANAESYLERKLKLYIVDK